MARNFVQVLTWLHFLAPEEKFYTSDIFLVPLPSELLIGHQFHSKHLQAGNSFVPPHNTTMQDLRVIPLGAFSALKNLRRMKESFLKGHQRGKAA